MKKWNHWCLCLCLCLGVLPTCLIIRKSLYNSIESFSHWSLSLKSITTSVVFKLGATSKLKFVFLAECTAKGQTPLTRWVLTDYFLENQPLFYSLIGNQFKLINFKYYFFLRFKVYFVFRNPKQKMVFIAPLPLRSTPLKLPIFLDVSPLNCSWNEKWRYELNKHWHVYTYSYMIWSQRSPPARFIKPCRNPAYKCTGLRFYETDYTWNLS